jgi:hypothetical protein
VTDFVLKRTVSVSPAPERGAPLFTLVELPGRGDLRRPEGTPIGEIPPIELVQLSPGHFVEVDDDGNLTGSGNEPDDWRTDEATLEHDRRQAKANAATVKDQARRKAAKNKAGG